MTIQKRKDLERCKNCANFKPNLSRCDRFSIKTEDIITTLSIHQKPKARCVFFSETSKGRIIIQLPERYSQLEGRELVSMMKDQYLSGKIPLEDFHVELS